MKKDGTYTYRSQCCDVDAIGNPTDAVFRGTLREEKVWKSDLQTVNST